MSLTCLNMEDLHLFDMVALHPLLKLLHGEANFFIDLPAKVIQIFRIIQSNMIPIKTRRDLAKSHLLSKLSYTLPLPLNKM